MPRSRTSAAVRVLRLATQSGFSLIEALVALLVLSIGMLGIAALSAHGLRAQRTALHRTIAVNLAADMADRIRGNRAAGAAYNAAAAPHACGASGRSCTPAELAAHDKQVWSNLVARQLPSGVGAVEFSAATPPTYTIVVSWQDVTGGARHEIAAQIAPL